MRFSTARRMPSAPLWKSLKARRASADTILQTFNIVTPQVPVEQIVQDLGIELGFTQQYAGELRVEGDRVHILVRGSDREYRQRFTMAHEIGHLMLHDTTEAHRDSDFSGTREEVQANRFAADLLMPLWMLDEAGAGRRTVADLARIFGVSEQAMNIRLSTWAGA